MSTLIDFPSPTIRLPTDRKGSVDEYLYDYDDFLESKLEEKREKYQLVPQKSILKNVFF